MLCLTQMYRSFPTCQHEITGLQCHDGVDVSKERRNVKDHVRGCSVLCLLSVNLQSGFDELGGDVNPTLRNCTPVRTSSTSRKSCGSRMADFSMNSLQGEMNR